MRRSIAVTRGPEYTVVRPKRVNDLLKLLNEHAVDLGQSQPSRNVAPGVQSLYDYVHSGAASLVLKPQERESETSSEEDEDVEKECDLALLSFRAYLHWQLGSKEVDHTLVNTHVRTVGSVKRTSPLPVCDRLVDQPYEQVVSGFLGRFLDMDPGQIAGKVGVIRVDYEKEFCQPSDTYPGITNIFAFFSVYFNLNMPLPLNFGRPIVRKQKGPADGDIEELWHWRPSQLCGNPLRTVYRDLSGFEAHERQDDILEALGQALGLSEEGEKAILRCLHCPYDSGRPVVLVVAVHRETLKTTQLVVAKVIWDVTDEEVSEQSRAGEELRRALSSVNRVASGPRNHLAKQIGGSNNYFFDLSSRMSVVALELPLACTEPPEVLSATLSDQLEVPFVLLRDVVAAAAMGRNDMTLAATLVPTLDGLLSSLVAPGSVLGRLMTVAQRASTDIVEVYRLDSLSNIMQTTDPRYTKYSIFHKATGLLIDELCKTVGIEDDIRKQLTEKLDSIKALCNRLEKRSWNKSSWRPLCCMAHGNLTPRSVVVDALGCTWLYDWGTCSTTISWQGHGKNGGQQPLFRDLARLSARVLFEGCRLPLSLRQVQQICAASWVDLSDLSRWFNIPKSVAYLFQRKMLETDFSKDQVNLASKAQATRRVSKMLEQAATGPVPGAAESLQGRLAGRDVDVRRAFREAQCLGRAIMALPLLGLPEGLNAARSMHSEGSQSEGEVDTVGDPNGPRGLAWKQQKALHTAAKASKELALERFLNDPAWVQKMENPEAIPKTSNVSLLPVDTSPLLLGLPLLEEVLALLVGTSLDPWQKTWGCSFAADLAAKLLPHLQALLGREPVPRSVTGFLESQPDEDQGLLGMDVRFAKGHRLSATGESKVCADLAWAFGSRQRSTDGTFCFRRECQLTPEFLEKALLGWPCPVAGVPPAVVTEHRRRLGALPAGDADLLKDEEYVDAVRTARRKNLWRRAAGALYEVEALSLKPTKRLNTQRRVANQGAITLALHEVTDSLMLSAAPDTVEELKILGQRLGLVGYVENAVQRCPENARHSDSVWAPLASSYDTFPCTLCRQKVSVGYPQEAYFAHCAECWLDQKRFALCRDCASAEPPRCPENHVTTCTEISPYDKAPSCRRCRAVVGDLGSTAPPGEPHWFHCASCRAANATSPDLCRSCAVLYCAAGHELEWIASFKGLKSVCQSCGTSGRLKVYHCSQCQEARCEVMYPTGLAAKADVKLGGRAGDVKVMAVAPGGAAATAGVVAGHRLLTVNDHAPAVASGAMFDGVKDQAVLLEFIATANFDVTVETAKALQEALVIETRHFAKGLHAYVTEVRSRALQQDGVDRGFRLLSVNGIEADELVQDERGVLTAATERCDAPYTLRFRQNGPKFLYHAGCGYLCDAGHALEPHFVGTTSCPKGHVLQAVSLDELSETCGTELTCEACCEAIFGPVRPTDRCYACTECLLARPSSAAMATEPSPVDPGRNYKVLCPTCTWKLYRQGSTESPYKHLGKVQCEACERCDLGPDAPKDAAAGVDARSFYHCEECWRAGAKHDVCYLCALRQLQCTSGHALQPLLSSPFTENLHCAVCLANLDAEEEAYHCRDCWWLRGTRLDRCVSCAGQNQIRYALDNDARMQVVPGNSPPGEITWKKPYEPVAHTRIRGPDGEVELEVKLKLHGLIYPMGTRICLSSLMNHREATITNLHETGKYILSLDGGDRETQIIEPDLTNHVPAGVWRYYPGQKLVVCVRGIWRDFKVHTIGEYGSRHMLEEVGPRDPSKRQRVEIDLNSYNHSPAWLSASEWWNELCRWEDHLVAGTLAADALTAQPTELLALEWCLVDDDSLREPPSGASTFGEGVFMHRSAMGPSSSELWSSLYRLTQKSPGREMGRFTAKEVLLLLGPTASGKTRLLQRLALEAVKAHDGEMVPFIVPAPRLLLAISVATKTSTETAYQKRHSRVSGKESEQICVKRLADTDFLLIYIRMTFGAGSRTTQFLRQALHSRRLLLLVDSLEQCPTALQNPLLNGLARLAVVGHRVVVTGSPSPEVFATFSTEKETEETSTSSSEEDEEDDEASADELSDPRPLPESDRRPSAVGGRRNSSVRTSTASIDFAALAERSAEMRRRSTQDVVLQDPWWCPDGQRKPRKRSKRVPRDQMRKLWLAPFSASQREDLATRRLGAEAAQKLLQELQDSDLLGDANNVIAIQSAPFFSLFLAHAEREKAESQQSRAGSQTSQEESGVLGGLLLPALSGALPRQVSGSSQTQKPPEPTQPTTGICHTLCEVVNMACDIFMSSIADVRMYRKGVHGAPKPEPHAPHGGGDPVRKALQILALHAQQNGTDRVNEDDALYAVEYGGSSANMRAFRELQHVTAAGNFLLLRRHECWRTWDELVIYYVFPSPCIQGYLASREIEETWMKPGCPLAYLEEAFEEPRWHSLLPFLASLLPGPLTLRFPSLTESKALLMTEFFARGPNVTYLNLSGAGLGLRRAALRCVAAALLADKHLLHLDVSSNSLGSEGVHTLCQALLEHPALLEFMLAKNHIGQVGAVKLVDLLRVNVTVQRIDLEDNPIGNEWANYIYVLQKDRSATMASAQEQAQAQAASKTRTSTATIPTLTVEFSKELTRLGSVSNRLRHKNSEDMVETVKSARTPRLLH